MCSLRIEPGVSNEQGGVWVVFKVAVGGGCCVPFYVNAMITTTWSVFALFLCV